MNRRKDLGQSGNGGRHTVRQHQESQIPLTSLVHTAAYSAPATGPGEGVCAVSSPLPPMSRQHQDAFVTFVMVLLWWSKWCEEEVVSATTAEVVSPAPTDVDELAKVLSFIEAHEARHGTSPVPAFFLSGSGKHDRVELTEQLHAILKHVVQALSHGQSISILTRDQELSTQQAAEILGLSRPTVVRLID